MRMRISRGLVTGLTLLVLGCGGPGGADDDLGRSPTPSVAPAPPEMFVPDPKAEASGEDLGAACAIGALPAATTNSKLPNPFTKFDGTNVSSKADWRCRREEIRKLAEKSAFGTKPPPPEAVTGSISETQITVQVTDAGKSSSFSAKVTLPSTGQAPYPAIIAYGSGIGGVSLDPDVIDSEGVAVITYDPYSVGAEGNGRGANQAGAFYELYSGGSSTGLLVAWAWGVSRLIDVIAHSQGSVIAVDALAVTGCSRFGKGAFLAGVLDERVALTMPIESGTGGVPLWRGIALGETASNGNGPQTLSSAFDEQPWFGNAFQSLTDNPTKALLDTHELVAMVAPRGLFVMDNPHIGELAPRSGHAAVLAGAEVYKALGAGENISYWSDVSSGMHCGQRPEWSAPLRDNLQKFLTKTGNVPGLIKADAEQSSNLADWVDWTTPTLP